MKTLSLFVSVVVFFTSGFYLNSDFRESTEPNYLTYMSLLIILFLISIVGILINLPMILNSRNKIEQFFLKIDLSGKQ